MGIATTWGIANATTNTYPIGKLADVVGNVTQTTTFPVGGWTQNKVFPATKTKLKQEKRQRKVLHGQNYLQLRGKY